MQTIIELINQYGYIILFCALTLELIAFPLPGETTMTYCGFLVYEGNLNWLLSILSASAGTIFGITISYFLGRKLGEGFFKKYGSYIHLGPDKLEKASKWFNTYGNSLLFIAYFIPGVRHITGYFSGITRISYKKFALYAYGGALIWTSTFITLGKFLGANWSEFHLYLKKYIVPIIIISSLILVIIYVCKNHINLIIKFFNKTFFDSSITERIKFTIAAITIILIGFFFFQIV